MTNGEKQEQWRVLALDGGGLYGLTTALWLKQLCQGDERFLADGDVRLFAGCSAGALNALLLAREKDPREFVLRGGLEAFFHQPGTFSNTNPFTAFWSLYQITAWFGAGDFLALLRSHFGDMTLGDLCHDVFITSFNWTGAATMEPPAPSPAAAPACSPYPPYPQSPWSPWSPSPSPSAAGGIGGGIGAGTGSSNADGWRPKFFKNFAEDEPDRRLKVVDVAYAAASPPGIRALLSGYGDAGSFNPCPAAEVTAAVLHHEKRKLPNPPAPDFIGDVLARTMVLSVGVGAAIPAYWRRAFDFSSMQFALYPTNPPLGNWWPPACCVSLEAPTRDAVYIASQLLGRTFHRLNPGLLKLPTSVAVYWSRFPAARHWLTQQIEAAVESPDSRAHVARTLEYLHDVWHPAHAAA